MILKTDFNIFFYKNFVKNMQTPSLGWQYKKKIPPPKKTILLTLENIH